MQTRNSEISIFPDPIAARLAEIAAKLQSLDSLKEDIMVLAKMLGYRQTEEGNFQMETEETIDVKTASKRAGQPLNLEEELQSAGDERRMQASSKRCENPVGEPDVKDGEDKSKRRTILRAGVLKSVSSQFPLGWADSISPTLFFHSCGNMGWANFLFDTPFYSPFVAWVFSLSWRNKKILLDVGVFSLKRLKMQVVYWSNCGLHNGKADDGRCIGSHRKKKRKIVQEYDPLEGRHNGSSQFVTFRHLTVAPFDDSVYWTNYFAGRLEDKSSFRAGSIDTILSESDHGTVKLGNKWE